MITGHCWKWLAGVALACVVGLSAGTALPHGLSKPRLESCYWVRGTLSLSGDNGFVIGRDRGGSVIIGSAHSAWPGYLQRTVDKAQAYTGYLNVWVHGTFKVCPIPTENPSQPWLHFVYIKSATHLTTEPAGDR